MWVTSDGYPVVSTNGECVRAINFADLGRDSCHVPMVEEVVVIEPVWGRKKAQQVLAYIEHLESGNLADLMALVRS